MRSPSRKAHRSLNLMTAGAIAAAAALLLSACTGASPDADGDTAAEAPTSLTIVASSPPASLDPARGAGPFHMFQLPVYGVLFHDEGIGKEPSPSMAESYEWIGEGSRQLQVNLRDGVVFSDGETPLDSAAVKASIEYFKNGVSGYRSVAASIESIETPDDLTVIFNFSRPAPTFVSDLAEEPGMGSIINPTALAADPEALGTVPAGAGPYVLSDKTVTGSEYHYTPNPEYFDEDAIEYSEIIIRVVADPNTALASLQAGQADVSYGSSGSYQRALDMGLQANVEPGAILGLFVNDWNGTITPALADQRVRLAINLALDRDALAELATQGVSDPTVQALAPGSLGYDESLNDSYPYDPDRAKELLEEAGYPDGFSMPVVATGSIPTIPPVAQAIAAQLGEIGVTVDLTVTSTAAEFAQAATTAGLNVGSITAPSQRTGMPSVMNRFLLPTAGFNASRTELPELIALANEAAQLTGDEAQDAWAEVNAYVVEEALLMPVSGWPTITYFTDEVESIGTSGYVNPLTVTPAS